MILLSNTTGNPSQFRQKKENLQALLRSLRVHILKFDTIPYSKAPKSHVKLITHINIDNGFYLLVSVVFAMSPQYGGLGTKDQYILISFCFGEGGTIPQFYLRVLQARSGFVLLNDETVKINNLTGKYITEL